MNREQFKLALQELKACKEDIRPSDIAFFSEPLRSTLNHAIRMGNISLSDIAQRLEIEREQAKEIVELLVAHHLFQISGLSNEKETFYETRLSAMTRPLGRPRPDIWKKIDDK